MRSTGRERENKWTNIYMVLARKNMKAYQHPIKSRKKLWNFWGYKLNRTEEKEKLRKLLNWHTTKTLPVGPVKKASCLNQSENQHISYLIIHILWRERERDWKPYSVAKPKRSAKGVIPNKLRKKTQACNPPQQSEKWQI